MDTEPILVGEWRVRLAEGVLERAGQERRLEPKVGAVLACLVRHSDRLVSKEHLLSEVWPDTVVAPIALARAISELRRALGDDRRTPRYIATYSKRGYRLIATVRAAREASVTPATSRRRRPASLIAALAVALAAATSASHAVPDPPSISVRPFASEGGAAADFAAGLTADVLSGLGRVGDVRPAPDARSGDPWLEGSVRVEGARVHVVARLVHGGRPIWSEAFDREIADAPRARQEVAARVVHGLRVHGLRPQGLATIGERALVAAEKPTAYDLFREGRALLARNSLEATLAAQRRFELGLRLDPKFALVRSGLALALSVRSELTGDPVAARQALAEARRSVAEDPSLAEAHHAVGRGHMALGQYQAALRANAEALTLRPAFLMAHWDRARIAAMTGRGDLALAELDRLEALDYPAWRGGVRALRGIVLLERGQDARARASLTEALRIDSSLEVASVGLARLDAYAGRHAEARRRLLHWIADRPGARSSRLCLAALALRDADTSEARSQAEQALALPGDPDPARLLLAAVDQRQRHTARAAALLAEVQRDARAELDAGGDGWGPFWSLAAVSAMQGDLDRALALYRRAAEAGRRDVRWDALDPAFESLRRQAGFRDLLRQGASGTATVGSGTS